MVIIDFKHNEQLQFFGTIQQLYERKNFMLITNVKSKFKMT